MTDGRNPDPRIRQVHIVSGGLAAGVLAYTGIAAALVVSGAWTDAVLADSTVLAAVALAVALLLVLAPVLRRRILEGREPPGDADEVLSRWVGASILGMALRDGAGVLGVTAGLLAASVPWILGFGIAALAAMGLAWPRGDEVRERMRRLQAGP